jgi:hypothetical protein
MEVDRPHISPEMELTLKRLKQAGIEPTLTEFLYDNIVAQVVVDCLLDNIEDLSRELDRLKCTNNTLTARLTDVLCKHPTSPINHSSDDEDHHPRKQHRPSYFTRERSSIPTTLETVTRWSLSPLYRREEPVSRRGSPPPRQEPNPQHNSPAHRMRERYTSRGKPARRINEPIITPYHDLPPLKKPKVQTTGPVRYDLPGELPQPQEKLKDTITPMVVEEQPTPPRRAQHLPDKPDSSEDDGMSNLSLSDAGEVLQGKGKSWGMTKKAKSKGSAHPGQLSDARRIYLASRPGCIPDGLGIVLRDGKPEHDNSMWGMVGRDFYYSALSNIIYIGRTAVVAMDYETTQGSRYTDVNAQRLYATLPRGFPMNPYSVVKVVRFV